jgi:hypothetical protein
MICRPAVPDDVGDVSGAKWRSSTPSRMSRTTRRPLVVPPGQVGLRDVAGDHDLAAEAESGEEHLHLLGRGVLRLVQDDERVVQRAAAHERQRRDLDRPGLDELRDRLGVEHVVQRVVERAQVRVDLLEQRAGQEAQPLPRLDRGPGQDDAVDLLGLQRLHGLGHRQVGLAGAGRADAEHDGVPVDRLDVAALVQRLGRIVRPRLLRMFSVSTSAGLPSCLSMEALRSTSRR